MSLADGGPEREIDEEIRHHLEELVDLLVIEGWEPEAARREAERRFGNVSRIREEISGVHGGGGFRTWIHSLAGDVRYAARGLRSHPTFTLSVVATVALGLGAAATIFAVVDAMLLRPLPYKDADRWMEVTQAFDDGGYAYGLENDRFAAWQEALTGVADAWIGYSPTNIVRTDGEQAEQLVALAVTPGAERLLGIPMFLGRGFTADDARPGAPPVAVLSRAYFERLGADRDILDSTIRTEVGQITVVGVLRGGMHFPASGTQPDVWIPIRDDLTWANRSLVGLAGSVWAHLAAGISLPAAQARADALAVGLAEQHPAKRTWKVRLVHVAETRANRDVKQTLWTLSATVAAIFLIALVNGINLTLVRASARLREVAVRLAIGGSRLRLLRHFVIEGALLGLLGGGAALLLGRGALFLLRGILPHTLVWLSPHAFTVEARTTTLVAGAALAAGLALGLLPALRALGGLAPAAALGGRAGTEDRKGVRSFRNGLVVLQVALTTTLLVVAGLLTHSMKRLLAEDPGFDVDHTADASVFPSSSRYHDAADRWAFAQRLKAALLARPEVTGVTVLADIGYAFDVELEAEGTERPVAQPKLIPYGEADADYVDAAGASLVEGRALGDTDEGQDNVLIDRDLARLLWPTGSAVGRKFRIDKDRDWLTVVGVLSELRLMGRDQREGPYQFLRAEQPRHGGAYLDFIMRTRGEPAALLPVFHETLRSIDPEQWAWQVRTSSDALAEEEQTPRFLLTVTALLAAIATTLSAVGLYGVLSYSVARRQRELGIRMALGADRGRLRRRVLREGISVAGIGLAVGLVGALALSGVLTRLLYRLEPVDPVTYAAVVAGLAAVAVLASSLPALRATRVDPVEVLRSE